MDCQETVVDFRCCADKTVLPVAGGGAFVTKDGHFAVFVLSANKNDGAAGRFARLEPEFFVEGFSRRRVFNSGGVVAPKRGNIAAGLFAVCARCFKVEALPDFELLVVETLFAFGCKDGRYSERKAESCHVADNVGKMMRLLEDVPLSNCA